jgi:hypothetical protein
MHANRTPPLLGKPPFVDDERGITVTRIAEHEITNVVPDPACTPPGGAEQALHTVRVLLPTLRGELPTVAPTNWIENST